MRDSCTEDLCLKNCLSSAVMHFNKGRMEREQLSLPSHSSSTAKLAQRAKRERKLSLQRDKQTDKQTASQLLLCSVHGAPQLLKELFVTRNRIQLLAELPVKDSQFSPGWRFNRNSYSSAVSGLNTPSMCAIAEMPREEPRKYFHLKLR